MSEFLCLNRLRLFSCDILFESGCGKKVRATESLSNIEETMGQSNRDEWPDWIRIGLWGVPSRRAAWAWFWLSLAIAVACCIYGFTDRRFFIGGFMVVASLMYYLSIRWVDKHGGWS
jgi:hypothetical protein